jgi:hypothetical protein
VGRVINKYKVAKHFHHTITDTTLTVERRHDQITAEAALDGNYVRRTSVPADTLDPAAVVAGYKNLAHVERDFRILKIDDLDLRPIHHHLTDTRPIRHPAAQLPRATRPPSPPHPQPAPVHHHQHRSAHARRGHCRPAPRLPTARRPHPLTTA